MSVASIYRLPASLPDELEQLREMAEQFRSGALPAARFQAFRVPQGIYEQRETGTFMLRARLAAGILLPAQMRVAAEVAAAYGNGSLHLTSRQDLQVHGVRAENIHAGVKRLYEAGLSTKGGGGNTVRNVASCELAGVCADEVFDVTAHVLRLTETLLDDPLSFQLPRKYKLAASGCARDCAGATINDLGFISRRREGVEGFAVYVGGGMGAQSRVGRLLEEFIPTAEAVRVAEAVKRVFDQHGNRKNRHRARLRFLVEDLGLEAFERLYRAELAALASPLEAGATAAVATEPAVPVRAVAPAEGFEAWRRNHVTAQRQAGFSTVEIAPPLGVLSAAELSALSDVVERHGEGVVRSSNSQSVLLRWVAEADLAALHAELAAIGLGSGEPPLLRHMVTCAGSATCRLGICLSRGLAQAMRREILASGLDLDGATGQVVLHISGCPNACGRHPLAEIGVFGLARRVNGRLVPHYQVQLGGVVAEGRTRLATSKWSIPARNLPAFVVDLLRAFQASAQGADFLAFLASGGRAAADELSARYARVPKFEDDPRYYYDWGAEEPFSLAGRGPGECGAGVFDLIQVDLASAEEALEAGRLRAATALAARALLVTRGEQADTERQSLELFERLFVAENLVPEGLQPLVGRARGALDAGDPETAFAASAAEVGALLEAVKKLYEGLGPSLRVAAPVCAAPQVVAAPASATAPDLEVDFRGTACPVNYVKTQMALDRLKPGQVLSIVLDEEGAGNVPESAARDGHEVLSVRGAGDCWNVIIRKGQ